MTKRVWRPGVADDAAAVGVDEDQTAGQHKSGKPGGRAEHEGAHTFK